MSDDNKLVAEVRTEFGKGAARRTRAAGRIPAVLYGHGSDPRHLSLPGHEVSLILRRANAILTLDVEGKRETALVKDVQRDPVRQIIEHLDLIIVKRGEKVAVDVPVVLEGESFSGTIVIQEEVTLTVEVDALDIPERLVVDIDGAEEGTQVLAGSVELPPGATLITDPEMLVALVTVPRVSTADDAEETEDEAPAAAAEPAADE